MQNLSNSSLLKGCSFIGGQWLDSENTFEVLNPSTQQAVAEVCQVTVGQIERAIFAAASAFKDWQQTSYQHRVEKLQRWQQLLVDNKADLARILTLEQGKPLLESEGEIAHGANYIKAYCEQSHLFENVESIPSDPSQQAKVYRRAIGVVTAITPWNFPCAMVIRKAAAAIAAGCTFVLKPSELTPLTALALAELARQAGIPDGVLNVVVGSNAQAIGEILTTHPKVAKFSFTGSTRVGKKLLQQCSFGVKRTSMELGGNAPFIVFEDADLDAAVAGAFASKFRNSGQTCVSANRFIVHQDVIEPFKAKLIERMKQLSVGDGLDPSTDLGPLINRSAIEKIDSLISESVACGAKITYQAALKQSQGYYFAPTLVENIQPNMPLFQREIFGPVIGMISFTDQEQAIQLANQTELGLCGYLYTSDKLRIDGIAKSIQVGMLGINQGRLSNPYSPFGGVKQSGMGREGGHFGVEEYLDYQFVCTAND